MMPRSSAPWIAIAGIALAPSCSAPDRTLGAQGLADAALDALLDSSCCDGSGGGTGGTGGASFGGSSGESGSAGQGGGDAGGSGAGIGGTGGDAGSCTCGALETCHASGICVALLVDTGYGYSIDATEVSWAQYHAWVLTNPPLTGLPSACAFKTSFVPAYTWAEKWAKYPINHVDWCDAYVYCKAVGKRLCGNRTGGAVPYSEYANISVSQWYNACTSGGVNNYPYGGDPSISKTHGYDPTACTASVAHEVGTWTKCVASPAGKPIFDLSGNLWEWEDSCTDSTGETDQCRVRGGAAQLTDPLQFTCGYDSTPHPTPRSFRNYAVGFRCCAP